MASRPIFDIDQRGMKDWIRRTNSGREAMKKPYGETRGSDAANMLRFGPRGIDEQFRDETEYSGRASRPWLETKAFGRTEAPRRTMDRSGKYRGAWLGGPGSKTTVTDKVLTIGVDKSKFPQVAIHQSTSLSMTIKPKRSFERTLKPKKKGGTPRKVTDFAMRWFLGLTHGVWMSIARIKKGLKIQRRRLSVSQEVRLGVIRIMERDLKAKIRRVATQQVQR